MQRSIRVYDRLFGGKLKAGDIIGSCNFLEHIRKESYEPDLQLYLPDNVIYPQSHCITMKNFVMDHTDYITDQPNNLIELSVIPGTDPTYSDMYNIWNIRKDVLYRRQNIFDIDDCIKIPTSSMEDIIVVVPLMDASYNYERNWDLNYTQDVLDEYFECGDDNTQFILVSKNEIPYLNLHSFQYCHDYRQSLEYIRKCRIYVGGDTGLSHAAGAIDDDKTRFYHYSKHTYGSTNPVNWIKNGTMVYY